MLVINNWTKRIQPLLAAIFSREIDSHLYLFMFALAFFNFLIHITNKFVDVSLRERANKFLISSEKLS